MTQQARWRQQLDIPPSSDIRPVPAGRKKLRAGQRMLYPSGRAVDQAIRAIPRGCFVTQQELRAALAQRHGADVVCPVTTGLALRVAAEAAHEAWQEGTPLAEVTPVWRLLDAKAPALKKLSFDPRFILDQRAREAREAREGNG